jgi:Sulfotransferase domain
MTEPIVGRLPNFLYIGPDKAGSSWLHEVLLKHPDVYLTPAKDLYFFDRYYDRGTGWYAEQFRDARDQQVVGEVCQDYLFHPKAAQRIVDTLGQVRVMVSLRDPVERAWSSYLYMRKHGIGPDTFADALRSRPELLEHGRYATGLDRFLEVLPRELVHVALFDDLTRDPQAYLDSVTRFLEVADLPLPQEDLAARLPAARARSVRLASAVRRTADWVRERDGARIVGRVKRSPLVQRALYQPIDRSAVRPDPRDVDTVRLALAPEVSALEQAFGLRLRESWGW